MPARQDRSTVMRAVQKLEFALWDAPTLHAQRSNAPHPCLRVGSIRPNSTKFDQKNSESDRLNEIAEISVSTARPVGRPFALCNLQFLQSAICHSRVQGSGSVRTYRLTRKSENFFLRLGPKCSS